MCAAQSVHCCSAWPKLIFANAKYICNQVREKKQRRRIVQQLMQTPKSKNDEKGMKSKAKKTQYQYTIYQPQTQTNFILQIPKKTSTNLCKMFLSVQFGRVVRVLAAY